MDACFLNGKRVAFTGRLASMTRAEAAVLVGKHGGRALSAVSHRTSVLVVGQDGWPLQQDGRLTNKLRRARILQRAGSKIVILPETDFLRRLGSESLLDGVRRDYSTVELSTLLRVPGDRIRRWLATGLIRAVQTIDGISHFDYRQVVSARTLCDLIQAGVALARLRRSIKQMQAWLGDIEQPLLQLAILERSGKVLVRLDDGLAEPTGQRYFDFADPADEESTIAPISGEQWFELGCEHEDAGQFGHAVEAYRQALLVGGPSAATCFNLANAFCALGQKERAIERYYQAVELDPGLAAAWNNLGVVLSDLRKSNEARNAFDRALTADPLYSDAHYNLADLLEERGDNKAALNHWRAYLRHDQDTEWAAHARERLAHQKAVGSRP